MHICMYVYLHTYILKMYVIIIIVLLYSKNAYSFCIAQEGAQHPRLLLSGLSVSCRLGSSWFYGKSGE